jgi:hypothetical protein
LIVSIEPREDTSTVIGGIIFAGSGVGRVSGFGTGGVSGFNPTQMTTAIIGLVAIVNIMFIAFLHMKQPNY